MTQPDENRVYISVVFTDPHEMELKFPIALMWRSISHFEVDGVRYLRVRERDWDDLGVND